jgi:hypothetical protein
MSFFEYVLVCGKPGGTVFLDGGEGEFQKFEEF